MTGPKILVIDDEQAVIESITMSLAGENYQVLSTQRADEGLALYRSLRPEVVLLNLKMTGMTGVEFLERMDLGPDASCSVIMVTGQGDDPDFAKCFELGASGFLKKPFGGYELRGIVDAQVKLHRKSLKLSEVEGAHRETGAELRAVLAATQSVLQQEKFVDRARALFDSCKALLGATAGYVALLSETGEENEVLFLDAGGRDCTVDPSLPMPIRGLRAEAYRSGQSVYDNRFPDSQWMDFMPVGHVRLDNVLFAPVILEEKVVGLIGLANRAGGFTDKHARLGTVFGKYVSIALRDSLTRESLENSEKRQRTVLETAVDAIVTADHQGRITSWNRAAQAMFGYSAPEIKGKPISVLVPDRFLQAHEEGMARLASGGPPKILGSVVEVAAKRRDGSDFPVELSLASWQAGETVHFTAILRDISERKEMEIELYRHREDLEALLKERTAKMLELSKLASIGELATGVAHEINQPLTYINAFLQSLGVDIEADQPLDMAELREMVASCSKQVSRITQIINNLRIFGRDGQEIEMSPVRVEQVLEDALLLTGERIRLKGIKLRTELAPDLPAVWGNSSRLQSVLLNLFQNAMDALEGRAEGAEIRVGVCHAKDEQTVVVTFADNGAGLPREHLDKIFLPFFTTKDVGRGTGLGLSIAYGIVNEHNGMIHCDSTEGEGTIFTIALPAEAGVSGC